MEIDKFHHNGIYWLGVHFQDQGLDIMPILDKYEVKARANMTAEFLSLGGVIPESEAF